jgi:hypothetical protein
LTDFERRERKKNQMPSFWDWQSPRRYRMTLPMCNTLKINGDQIASRKNLIIEYTIQISFAIALLAPLRKPDDL